MVEGWTVIADITRTMCVVVPALSRIAFAYLRSAMSGSADPQVFTVEGPAHASIIEQYAYCVNELNSSVDVELKDRGNIGVQTLNMMRKTSPLCWAADIHITRMINHLYARPYRQSITVLLGRWQRGE